MVDGSDVHYAKLALAGATGLSKDALHIYVGLLLLFGAALALRRPLRSALPWLVVLAVAVVGEVMDLRRDAGAIGQPRWGDSLHDLLNTIFWPTVIVALARFTRLFGAHADR